MKTQETTQDRITEGNKLIAEFMGAIIREKYGCEEVEIHDLVISAPIWDGDIKYNQSWDWLMPVVEKIEQILPDDGIVTIEYKTCYVTINQSEMDIVSNGNSKIEAVYNVVIDFIQWYNQQKAKP